VAERRFEAKTDRGYNLFEVASALQKAVRRGDAKMASYWGLEMAVSGYGPYFWRRALTISAEDCFGVITKEVLALAEGWREVTKVKKGPKGGRVFVAKAAIMLALCRKSRDADHAAVLLYDRELVDRAVVDEDLLDARQERAEIPEYAYDVHTREGRMRGMTKADFLRDEYKALYPRVAGELDDVVEEQMGLFPER
jgi:replication-associated recombination protein RarA